jgi:hypothetical protein
MSGSCAPDFVMTPVDVTVFVLRRLWELRDLPENEFKGRAEELLYLYCESWKMK